MQIAMFNEVRIDYQNGALVVRTPYDPALVAQLKAAIPASDRKWEPAERAWLVAPMHATTVQEMLSRHFRCYVELPDGLAHAPSAAAAVRLLDVRYIGAAKERGDGTESAFGWCDGEWSVIIPKAVLMAWFGAEQKPGAVSTLYARLGVSHSADATEIRKAWKRLARQWHPDVCREPDAAEQFQAIQSAYEILADDGKRARYEAGLALQATVTQTDPDTRLTALEYRAPLRCGWILATGRETLGRFVVEQILQWSDIVDARGRVLVTTWPMGAKTFDETWVEQ